MNNQELLKEIAQIAESALERGRTGRVVDRPGILEDGLEKIIKLCEEEKDERLSL